MKQTKNQIGWIIYIGFIMILVTTLAHAIINFDPVIATYVISGGATTCKIECDNGYQTNCDDVNESMVDDDCVVSIIQIQEGIIDMNI